MKEKVIKTKLIGREDLFKTFLVGELSQLPVLVIGEKGTAKTQAFLDYVNGNKNGKVFLRQLNYDTRAEDLLGYISIPALKEGRVERLNGIQDAEYILLDEIDKAPSSVRNLFLSVLRERAVFDGEKFVPCKWKLIVGTSNREIEDFEQEDIPFLDRFVIKYKLEKVGVAMVDKLLEETEQEITIPVKAVEQDTFNLCKEHIKKIIIEELYPKMSDRAVASIPNVLKSVLSVYYNGKSDLVSCMVKTLTFLIGEKEVINLMDKFNISPEMHKAQKFLAEYQKASDNDTKEILIGKMVSYLKELSENKQVNREVVQSIGELFKEHISV